jgi:hypothetical protein
MGDHGDELRFHLIEFFQVTNVLENGDRTQGLADIVSYRCRVSPKEDFSGFADAQLLGNRGITHVLRLKTFLDGLRKFVMQIALREEFPKKRGLGNLEHPARGWIGEDNATIPITYQDTVAHAIDDRFEL